MKSGNIGVVMFLLAATATAQPSPNPQNMDPYGYQRFTPAMAIIIVVLIAALFFMGFFAIYIRQRQSESVGTTTAVTGRSRRAAARGLEASVIATFPTMEYSEVKGLKIGKGALECAVCICEFEEDETLRLIPKCDHVFHPECIDAWLASHTTCPVCRADLVPDPDQPAPHLLPSPVAVPTVDVEAQLAGPSDPAREVLQASKTLNRNRTRSGGSRRVFPRSHSTGHSVVQAGESTERFTLRLPVEVRKVMVNRQLVRASSMVLPREGSSRRGYRTAGGARRLTKSDRWVFSSFLARMSSFNAPKVASLDAGEERMSDRIVGPDVHRSDANRPPV